MTQEPKQVNKLSLIAAGYLLVWFIGSFWGIAAVKSGLLQHVFGIEVEPVKPYLYYAFSGAIGGTLYALRLLQEYFGKVDIRWLVWYITRPIICAGAALIMIVMFQSGVMMLDAGGSISAKISIAFLVGYGFGKFIDKLKLLTETLFNGKPDSTSSGPNPEKGSKKDGTD
ncbi:hypothetical protein [Paenibacillus thalictri]|uniref:hypothetical protein n=1 Tax=Paenibacillus thalictri TaxID=2527873 RepID=UPI0019810885|nr:hypothetical protein [Paenibacillus thalictri]